MRRSKEEAKNDASEAAPPFRDLEKELMLAKAEPERERLYNWHKNFIIATQEFGSLEVDRRSRNTRCCTMLSVEIFVTIRYINII